MKPNRNHRHFIKQLNGDMLFPLPRGEGQGEGQTGFLLFPLPTLVETMSGVNSPLGKKSNKTERFRNSSDFNHALSGTYDDRLKVVRFLEPGIWCFRGI